MNVLIFVLIIALILHFETLISVPLIFTTLRPFAAKC